MAELHRYLSGRTLTSAREQQDLEHRLAAGHSPNNTLREKAPNHQDANRRQESKAQEEPKLVKGWRARSEFWTWNCFTVNMGTGGLSILIGGCPFDFGVTQRALGTIFFLINLIVFVINVSGVLSRAYFHPQAFKASWYDHEDGVYAPCFSLAWATLFVGIIDYGVPYCGFWLVRAMEVVWFVYIAVGLAIGMTLEWTVRGRRRSLSTITPADCLLLFPLMLGGTLGSALATKMPGKQATYVIILSYMLQGMGWLMAILKLSVWMARNMIYPSPAPPSIPGFLMAVGPPGFTAFAFMNLGNTARTAFPASGILSEQAGETFRLVSVWYGLMLLGMALYLLLTPVFLLITGLIMDGKIKSRHELHKTWGIAFWSFTFPLVGFFMAIGQLGTQLPSKPFKVIQVVGIFIVAVAWFVNFPMTMYSIFISKELLQPKPKKGQNTETYETIDGEEIITDPEIVNNVMKGEKQKEDRDRRWAQDSILA